MSKENKDNKETKVNTLENKDVKTENTTAKAEQAQTKKETREERKAKLRRIMIDGGGPLYVDKENLDPNKYYRIFNQTPGSMDKARKLGYVPTTGSIQVGNEAMSGSINDGSSVFNVGRNTELKGVLMEISKEHKEDIDALKREKADQAMAEALDHKKRYDGDIKRSFNK